MKQRKTSLLLLTLCLTFFSFKQIGDKPGNVSDRNNSGQQVMEVTSSKLDINNISTWYRTNGAFNRNPVNGTAGFEWPKGSLKTARYASGIWMGCISGNDTLTAIAEYVYDYKPGYVDDAGLPQGNEDPLFRIYKITRGDTTSPDYQNWPVNQGAYVTESGTPFFLGTETMFYSYTDAYPHASGQTSVRSLKAQILQTNWSYINLGMADIQYIEYRIINRSSETWNDTYINVWTDDDLGGALDDRIGCDTVLGLGYTYNATDTDPVYGVAPPAVGFKSIRNPIVSTGNNNDTVKYYDPPGSQNLVVKVGYKYSSLSVMNTYNNASPQPSDPRDNTETYRVISGYWRTGEAWINPVTNQPTKFAYSGDPVTGTGWVMNDQSDRRFILGFGPLNMAPNDTQSIVIAQVIARGSSNINSITQLKNLSNHAQSIYDQNFQSVLAVDNVSSQIPDKYALSQNYPNPFNPTTNLEFRIRESGFVTLKIFDQLGREVKTLVNERLAPGSYKTTFDGAGLSSGIYFYSLSVNGFTDTKRMILLK